MKSKLSPFKEAYSHLNVEQKHAVDMIEGPVMVVAGPGTGKTQILTLRIANILLKTQVNPSSILALTFTQAAATNMRERLGFIIGPEAHMVNIFTFHAFCAHIIEQNPDDFWSLLGMKLADDVQKAEILERIIDEHPFEFIKPYGKPYFYIPDGLQAISDLKREGASPKEFVEYVVKDRKDFEAIPDKESTRVKGSLKGVYQQQLKYIEKNSELGILYTEYQKRLISQDLYDYDDLIVSVLEKLRDNEDFRLRLMEQYQYILVDEHQDSNNAQNKIVQLLTSFHPNPNIFVVGDEKQAIFRFQGASVENFRRFTKIYPGAKLITLTENYRSTQTILDSAVGFLAIQNQRLHAKAKHTERPIEVVASDDPHGEILDLSIRIAHDIKKGVLPDDIAVLTRTRVQMQTVAQALASTSVPVYMDFDQDVFESDVVRKLIILLQSVRYYAQEEYLFPALHLDFFHIYPLDLYKLTQMVNRERKKLSDILADEKKLKEYGIHEPGKVAHLFAKLGEWYILSQNTTLHPLVHKIVQESGLLDSVLKQPNPILAVAPLRELYDIIQALDQEGTWRLQDLFTYLEKLTEHHIRVKVKVRTQGKGKVQVMTVHSSKGLEFDHVYIPFVQDTVWGKEGKGNLFKLPSAIYDLTEDNRDDNEQKRLFFVALTRARKHVVISYAKTGLDGAQILPSPYVSEIQPELRSHVSAEPTGQTAHDMLSANTSIVEEFTTFVQASFSQYGLSVSALNNYLDCPWKYFYVNLVRVPSGKDKVLMFGNAIHNALTYFYKHYKETGEKSCDYLLQAYEKSAEHELFTKAEIGDALVKGKQILTDYFKQYEQVFSRNVQIKYRIAEVLIPNASEGTAESIKLTGELDLVQFTDNSLSNVIVIDFKTGKPKTRNDILGTTKTSNGNYYRQLVFYKLLLQHFKPSWRMQQGIIDFIQTDNTGKFHREAFEIPDEEVKSITAQIQEVANDIVTLSFWDRHCDEPECEWCMLRKSLGSRITRKRLF